MAHLALYREWRPQTFAEVVGQQHVTRTLRNALALGRLSHAYLFCGPRGTGKTSVARILAKAVNCPNARGGEPDNTCDICRRITSGEVMDVIEIDAASNRGIDEIRDLREKVKYAPTVLKYKVYIIDEVHMLTEPAFNALLKTLEEPPGHVIFILATTEAHKVPVTIRSRCQRYDFHRLSTAEIVARLQEVCSRHGFRVEPEALTVLARQAEGGMRDALSLLDQLTAYAEPGQTITLADALAVLGAAPLDRFLALDDALAEGNAGAALVLLDELVREGKDLRQFVRDWLGHLRDLLLLEVSAEPELLDLPSGQVEELRARAGRLSRERLMSSIQLLAQLESELRYASNPRLLVEVALIRLCHLPDAAAAAPAMPAAASGARPVRTRPATSGATDALSDPPPVPAGAAPGGSPGGTPASAPGAAAAGGTGPVLPIPAAETPELRRVREIWPEVIHLFNSFDKTKPTVPFLQQATPYAVEGRTVVLAFPAGSQGRIARDMVQRRAHAVERAFVRLGLEGYKVRTIIIDAVPSAPEREQPLDLVRLIRDKVGPDVPVVEIKEE